jgi:uncharacterized protein (TIGR00730 family)
MILTVFGGSSPQPDSPLYEICRDLGRMAAQAGWTVATGGYMGVMEAVSRGAAESGGHVIGVTCDELNNLRPVGANPWVTEVRNFPSLKDRLWHLVEICDGAIAMPGGIGTLAEITVMWNSIGINSIPPKPLVLVGDGWANIINALNQEQSSYMRADDLKWIKFLPDAPSAFQQIADYTTTKNTHNESRI